MKTDESEDQNTRQAGASAGKRLEFESLLSELSARFINLPPDKVDYEIGVEAYAYFHSLISMDVQ